MSMAWRNAAAGAGLDDSRVSSARLADESSESHDSTETVRACVVCWNQRRAVSVDVTDAGECTRCRQQFKAVQLERDKTLGGQWRRGVEVRERPPGNREHDFELCAFFRKGRCSAGTRCSFAHSEEERQAWNQQQAAENWRQVRPRPRGIQGRFSLCKTQVSGTCVYGDKCTFAHSQLERRVWNSAQGIPNTPTSQGTGGGMDSAPSTPSSGASYNSAGTAASKTPSQNESSSSGVAAGWPAGAAAAPASERKEPPPPHQLRGPLGNIFSAARHLHAQRHKAVPAGDFRDSPSGTSAWRKGAGTALSVQEQQQQQQQQQGQSAQGSARAGPDPRASTGPGAHARAAGGTSRNAWGLGKASPSAAAGGGLRKAGAEREEVVVRKTSMNPLLRVLEDGGPEAQELLRDKGGIEITEANGVKPDVLVSCDGPDDEPSNSMSSAWGEGGSGAEVPLGGRVRASWVFRIRNCNPKISQMLVSVCTLDISQPDFRLVMGGEPAASKDRLADERLLRQSLDPGQEVEVMLQMRSHQLALTAAARVQWVIFKFNGFVCARRVSVMSVDEDDLLAASMMCKASMEAGPPQEAAFGDFQEDLIDREEDIFWDCAHAILPFEPADESGGGGALTEYVLPPDVASKLEDGSLDMLSQSLALERCNYRRRMHNLLFVEEYERRKAVSRHNVLAAELVPMTSWLCHDGHVLYPPPGEVLLKLDLEDAFILETGGAAAVSLGDWALLWPQALAHAPHDAPEAEAGREVAVLALVFHVSQGHVVLRLKAEVMTQLQSRGGSATCDVRFASERDSLVAMHRAVDAVDLSLVFPDASSHRPSVWHQHEAALERVLGDTPLDALQAAVVAQILGPGGGGGGSVAPLLLVAPFGTGKSRIFEEAVLQLIMTHSKCRVLLCTAHESTADEYLLRLAALLKAEHARQMMRVCGVRRCENDIPEGVLRYCLMSVTSVGTHKRAVTRQDIETCSIVVTTMMGADELARTGVGPEGFSHILIDEAAQVPEPLVLIPLSLAGRRSRVVLAGDHKLPGSWAVTPVARRLGLAGSALERLITLPFYQQAGGGGGAGGGSAGGVGSGGGAVGMAGFGGGAGAGAAQMKVLVRNYRNHPAIVSLAAKLFYGGDARVLLPRAPEGRGSGGGGGGMITPSHWHSVEGVSFPVIFVGVQGKELKDPDSPSVYNNFEALEVADRAYQLVCFHGVAEKDIVVLAAEDKQVWHLVSALLKRSLTRVRVTDRVGIMALEPRVLLVSTVRLGPGAGGGSGLGGAVG